MRDLSIIVLLFPLTAQAGQVIGFGSDQPVTLDDFRPRLHDNEGYSESWSHGAWMPGGGDLGIDFAITNLGIGDHKGRVSLEFRNDEDKSVKCSQEFADDEWHAEGQGLHLKFGASELQGDLSGLSVKVRCGEIEADLRFETQGVPFKPGSGKLSYRDGDEEEGYYHLVYTSPRAHVTGTIRVKGVSTPIDAIGFGDHMRTTLRPDHQARRWFRFSYVKPEISILMAELESPPKFGSARNGWVVVYDSDGRKIATANVRFEFDGFIQDSKAEEGYSIPRRARMVAAEPGTSLTGSLVMKKISAIVDPLADLSSITRAFVRGFTKPRDYYIECDFSFQLRNASGEKSITGSRFFRFAYINP